MILFLSGGCRVSSIPLPRFAYWTCFLWPGVGDFHILVLCLLIYRGRLGSLRFPYWFLVRSFFVAGGDLPMFVPVRRLVQISLCCHIGTVALQYCDLLLLWLVWAVVLCSDLVSYVPDLV
jgi:hypothetical protein